MALDLTVNAGNLIALVVAVVGVVWRMSALSSAQERTAEKVAELQDRTAEKVAELQSHRDRHDHRIRGVEQAQVAIVTELKSMSEMLREVRDAVRTRGP